MNAGKRSILMLGGSRQQVVAIKKAKALGYRTVLCDYLPDNPGQYVADVFYQESTTDRERMLEVARAEGVSGVLAYSSDPAAPTAGYVAEALGLPTNPLSAIETMSEKHLFRAFLARHGLPCPRALGFSADADSSDLWEQVKDFSMPVVIKPTDSSGSKGVTVLSSEDGLPAAIAHAAEFSRNRTLICEEYISKTFPHVIGGDIFVVDGEVRFWGLMSCLRDESLGGLVPVGEFLPSGLPDAELAGVKDVLQRLVAALGIRFGELNVEVIVGEGGVPYVLELGARAGGNMIPVQLSDASGVDLVAANVLAAMGEDSGELSWDSRGSGAMCTYVLHSNAAGTFRCLELSDEIASHIYREVMYVDSGDTVEALDGANKALGILFLRFDSEAQMGELMSEAASHIHPVVEAPLMLKRVDGEDALREAWAILGYAYDPPLWERMSDYDVYIAKVAANAVTLVADDGGAALGGVSFYANNAEGREAFITQLMVAPRAQGMGLGTRLVAECEAYCREEGMETLALEVRADNDGARRLYERLGFEEFGRTERGFLMRKAIGS